MGDPAVAIAPTISHLPGTRPEHPQKAPDGNAVARHPGAPEGLKLRSLKTEWFTLVHIGGYWLIRVGELLIKLLNVKTVHM